MSSSCRHHLVPLRRQARRVVLAGVAVVVLSAACGSDDDSDAAAATDETTTSSPASADSTTTTTTATGGGEVAATISLDIEVTSDGQPARQASLTCNDQAEGTGFLADPQAAAAACELLRSNPDAVRRLVEGPDPNLLCTEIYGGPQVARVQGTVEGQAVEATIERTDGCGIADWDLLTPLIGSADF